MVQVYGTNALQVSDKRGRLHNVHITDVRKINMTEKVVQQLKEVYDKGQTAKSLIPQGLILDLGWNTDQQGPKKQPLPKEKQKEVAATQIMPTQIKGPPSSNLRSKMNKHKLPHAQDQQDPPERKHTTMNLQSITHEIHQVHIFETICNTMQVVLPTVLIGILLLINVFFYFRL